MTPETIGVISIACMFGGALIGLGLQRLLPKHHLSKESQDVVKLGAGAIAAVTALVLGVRHQSSRYPFGGCGASKHATLALAFPSGPLVDAAGVRPLGYGLASLY